MAKWLRILGLLSAIVVGIFSSGTARAVGSQRWYINGDINSSNFVRLTRDATTPIYNLDTYTWGYQYGPDTAYVTSAVVFAAGTWNGHIQFSSPFTYGGTLQFGIGKMDSTTGWSLTPVGSQNFTNFQNATSLDLAIPMPEMTILAPSGMFYFYWQRVGGYDTTIPWQFGGTGTYIDTTPCTPGYPGAPAAPTLGASSAADITHVAATLSGSLSDRGTWGEVTLSFDWGLDTSYGNTASAGKRSNAGGFSAALSDLTPDTVYHFRAKAVGDGTTLGDDLTFRTLAAIAPAFTTQPVSKAVNLGLAATFTSVAMGSPSPAYQWQRLVSSTWTDIPGANGNAYTTAALTLADDGAQFRVIASNGVGSPATSNSVIWSLNHAPTITAIANQTTSEDAATAAIAFTIGDQETPVGNLTLVGTCSTNLIPVSGIVFGGSGANRTVKLTPAANASGTANIRVRVNDPDGGTNSVLFSVTVNAVNDPPTISAIANQTINEDTSSAAIPFTIGDVETPAANLTLVGTCSTSLIPVSNIVFGGSGASRTVKLTPAPNAYGTANIRVRVNDPDGGTNSVLFSVTVNAVNDPPTITAIANQTLNEDTSSAAIAFTIGDVETPAASLTLVGTCSTNLIPVSGIVFGGSGANRTVKLTPAPNRFGTANVRVRVNDADGGTNSVLFAVTVNSVNDAPSITAIASQTIQSNASSAPIPFTIGDVETAPESLTLVGTCSTTLIPVSNIVFGGSGASRTVTLTPAAGQAGTCSVRVRVNDADGGTNSTLFTVTVAADNPAAPIQPVKLVFVHHSTGGLWLADDHGQLGLELMNNNYFVSATNYGWGPGSIGDSTDIGNWYAWFGTGHSDTVLSALYSESNKNIGGFGDYTRLAIDPGGENEVIVFKSCFPNSALAGSVSDPVPDIASNPLCGQGAGSAAHTVANAKGIYQDLLPYFQSKPGKLFVVITAPPLSDATYGANARALNNWLVDKSVGWLKDYPLSNVAVFDFYNVLTSNGGGADSNDYGLGTGNHHRWWNGLVQHKTDGGANVLAYPTGDDHPSAAGDQKATLEFVPMLNIFYHRWKH